MSVFFPVPGFPVMKTLNLLCFSIHCWISFCVLNAHFKSLTSPWQSSWKTCFSLQSLSHSPVGCKCLLMGEDGEYKGEREGGGREDGGGGEGGREG